MPESNIVGILWGEYVDRDVWDRTAIWWQVWSQRTSQLRHHQQCWKQTEEESPRTPRDYCHTDILIFKLLAFGTIGNIFLVFNFFCITQFLCHNSSSKHGLWAMLPEDYLLRLWCPRYLFKFTCMDHFCS